GEPLWALARPNRIYGGGCDRPGNFPVLARAANQFDTALRADRGLGLRYRAARRRNLRRQRRQAELRSRSQDRRQGRGSLSVARRFRWLLQGSRQDRRNQDARWLGAFGRRRLLRSEERPPENHRSRQGRRPAHGWNL